MGFREDLKCEKLTDAHGILVSDWFISKKNK
jgi:hypothetical protein